MECLNLKAVNCQVSTKEHLLIQNTIFHNVILVINTFSGIHNLDQKVEKSYAIKKVPNIQVQLFEMLKKICKVRNDKNP